MHLNSRIIIYLLSLFLVMGACQNKGKEKHTKTTNDPKELSGKDTYVNPVDGQTYHTEGEWKEHLPEEQRVNDV